MSKTNLVEIRGNTFIVKEKLKALGARWDGANKHKAKGLEWNKVVLLEKTFKSKEGEEGNVLYVAVTRAKRTLIFAA